MTQTNTTSVSTHRTAAGSRRRIDSVRFVMGCLDAMGREDHPARLTQYDAGRAYGMRFASFNA